MASYTYDKLFDPAQLGTSGATYYTVPTGSLLRDGRILLANTTAAAATYTVHVVPSGGSASDTNAIVKGRSMGPNDFIELDLPRMEAGDTLQALAGTATAISIHYLSGVLYAA